MFVVLAFIIIALIIFFFSVLDYAVLLTLFCVGVYLVGYSIYLLYHSFREGYTVSSLIEGLLLLGTFIYGYIEPIALLGKGLMPIFSSFTLSVLPGVIIVYLAKHKLDNDSIVDALSPTLLVAMVCAIPAFIVCSVLYINSNPLLYKVYNPRYKMVDARADGKSDIETINDCLSAYFEQEKNRYPEKSKEELLQVIKIDMKSESTFNGILKEHYYSVINMDTEASDIWIFKIKDQTTGEQKEYKINMKEMRIEEGE